MTYTLYVRFFIPFTKHIIVCRFVNFASIDLILFSFESGSGALYFTAEICWKKGRNNMKKWRWKKTTSRIKQLWTPFLHTRHPYLRQSKICNWFFIRNIISSKIKAVLGTIDKFVMFTFWPCFQHTRDKYREFATQVIIWVY